MLTKRRLSSYYHCALMMSRITWQAARQVRPLREASAFGRMKRAQRLRRTLTAECANRFFELFSDFLREKPRKREKTGENGSLSPINEKNSKKRVDNLDAIVYNKQACLAGIHLSCISEKEVSCMAAAGVRVKITLACTECKQRNYNT
ncbi:MAG: hypothetical protein ACI4MM_09075, partial [Candidatus Ventricola sp.]